MTRIPDKDEHRRRWTAIDLSDRRRIMKAVNRGEALEQRAEAVLAVGVARQQQRFWSRAWLLGPVVSLIFAGDGLVAYAANALVAGAILGLMSWFWYRRSRRAEEANLAVLGITRDPGTDAADDADGADGADSVDDRAGTPPVQNPPKRSRAQRRRGR